MTTGPEERDESPTEEQFRALLSLHASAGRVDASRVPGFSPLPLEQALDVVTAATKKQISVSARLDALHALAQQELPGFATNEQPYRALLATVVEGKSISVDDLLRDLRDARTLEGGFQASHSRAALAHHEAAFVGQDVCTIRRVTVDGRQAVWIFSEFETDADFDHVATWLDPQCWSKWGRFFFRRMAIIGSDGPIELPPLGTEHWHALFQEIVQFPWTQLNTLLHCDYWRDGNVAAGMTYDLNRSVDSQIDVDRGFILVTQTGSSVSTPPPAGGPAAAARPILRVKVLKIVGFTEDVWDLAAEWSCPFWTEWIRWAVEGATMSRPATPSHHPGGSGTGCLPGQESAESWIDFFGESARPYLDLFQDVTSRVSSSGVDLKACLNDEKRYWSLLAKDWATAWGHGLKTLEDVAQKGLDAGFGPPGTPGTAPGGGSGPAPSRDQEGTTIPVDGLGPNDRPVCTELTSIEAGPPIIASRDVVATVEPFDGGRYAVRLRTTDATAPPGLYLGQLTIAASRPALPVQLYVSRAVEA